MADINIIVAFTAGLLSFLSPCVLPIIPSYLSFVSGVSLGEINAPHVKAGVRRRVVFNSLAFIAGFSIIFVSLGASASYLASLFFGYRSFIRTLGGAFIILVGIYLAGFLKIPLLDRHLQLNLRDKPAGYLGSVLVGVTFGAAWIPCVGPVLGAILTLAGTSADIGKGDFSSCFVCRGPGRSFLCKRRRSELLLSVFEGLPPLRPHGSRRRWYPLGHGRYPACY